jgi:glycosyltransferase involved in cell wall biosynthesis
MIPPAASSPILMSIIVPTCGRPDDLRRCLRALVDQMPADGSCDLHVCDDSPDSRTRDMVAREFPVLRWHEGPRRGPAANRNLGVAASRGEWVLFIDDDCLPHSVLLASYRGAIDERRPAGTKIFYGPTFRAGPARWNFRWEAPHNPTGEQLISCNLCVERALFLSVSGFDERFPSAAFEDTEFEARVTLLGVERFFVADAAVDHPLRPLPAARKLAGRWEPRVINAHDLGATPRQIFWGLSVHVAKAIVSRFRGRTLTVDDLRVMPAFAGEFFFVLAGLPGWIGKHCARPRKPFWIEQANLGRTARNFGF